MAAVLRPQSKALFPQALNILLVALLALSSSAANAASAFTSVSDFSGLETPGFKILSHDACLKNGFSPPIKSAGTSTYATGIFGWVPTGAATVSATSQCAPNAFENRFALAETTNRQASIVKGFLNQCDKDLRKSAPAGLVALAEIEAVQYNLCDHPDIRKVLIQLPNGDSLRGYLALKPGKMARPLVIVRCGIFCNAGDAMHRSMIMHLFDESPFNVLAIGNIAGSEYVKDNGYLALGGFLEGQQLIALAKMIRTSPLNSRVSSIHAAGISLGGQGVLFASYLNSYHSEGSPLLASALAISPVVDLQPSMEDLFTKDGIMSTYATSTFITEIGKVLGFVPGLKQFFPTLGLGIAEITAHVGEAVVSHYKTQAGRSFASEHPFLAPFTEARFSSVSEFWKHNTFSTIAARESISTPTLVIAAQDDMMVKTAHNSDILNSRKLALGSDNGLAVAIVPSGNHVAFDIIYGWQLTSSMYRAFILSHSPELLKNKSLRLANVDMGMVTLSGQPLWKTEIFDIVSYDYEAQTDHMTANVRVFTPYGACSAETDPQTAQPLCFRNITLTIPFAAVKGSPAWAKIPRTDSEAESMTRWANANLKMLSATGKAINASNVQSAQFRWTNYDEQ